MKRNIKTGKVAATVISFLLLGVFVAVFFNEVLYLCSQLVAMSAESFLPDKSISFSSENTPEKQSTYPQNQTAQQTTAEQTVETKADKTEKNTAAKNSDLTDTDSDIKKLMKEYKTNKDEKGGDIVAKTYKNDGVTDSFSLVRVKNTNKTQINIQNILKQKVDLKVNKDEPSVLIFHTHTTETYQIADTDYYAADFAPRSESEKVNMVRVGDAIAEQLEKAGYKVIHDREIHDGTYSGAYARSRKKAQQYLEKYPSIEVVLDIHRDAIQLKNGTKIKPVASVNGKNAAQIMIISGCQEQGNGIENLPDWKYNLTFAVHLQNILEQSFPGITRPLFFCARSYNMNLSHCSVLIEVGSDANTLEEAVYSGKCLGVSLGELMKEYT